MDAEQHVADRVGSAGERVVQVEPHPVEQQLPQQRVAVGVEPAGRQPDQRVPRPHPVRRRAPLLLHHAHDEAGQVVVPGGVEVGHLGRLAAQQRAAVLPAPRRHPRHHLRDHPGLEHAHPDVIEEEERARALDQDVVHAVVHEVVPHRVVLPGAHGHLQLGPHAIRARYQHGRAQTGRDAEEPAERARLRQHALDGRGRHQLADPPFRALGDLAVHPGVAVAQTLSH